MQAALDVFNQEPPPADGPLHNRPDVVCTPHLGASTTEAQEGVAVEIADAVIGALKVSTALQPPFAAVSWGSTAHPSVMDVLVDCLPIPFFLCLCLSGTGLQAFVHMPSLDIMYSVK